MNQRLLLEALIKAMAIAMGLGILVVLGSQIFSGSDALEDIQVETLANLKTGEGRKIDWQGRPLWLIKRSRNNLVELRDLDAVVRDPSSEEKPLPTGVSKVHRGLLSDYLLVFAKGDRCEVEFHPQYKEQPELNYPDAWYGGFYEPCTALWYDLAGRVYPREGYAPEHLKVPDYRIVGAQLLIGQAPER